MRTYLDRNSLSFHLFRLVVLVAIATLAISMIGSALFEWNSQQTRIRQSLSAIAQAVGLAASAAVVFHDNKAAGEALRILEAHQDIEAAALYDMEGYRLATFGDKAGLPDNDKQLHEHQPSFGLFQATTTLYQQIQLDGATIAHVFIRASLKSYHQNLLLQAGLSIGVNLAGLLLVLGLGVRFLDRIVKPVKALADTSRQVRESRDFSLRAPASSVGSPHDEIGELISDFNAMLTEIDQRKRELDNYHKSLENMVEERTEALRIANKQLLSAKEQAEASALAKSRFLAAASHDLRQPIQAINLFQNALGRSGLSEDQQRINNLLAASVKSIGELLNVLLDISRLDAGAVKANIRPVEANDLFESLAAEFYPLATAKSLSFRLHLPPGQTLLFSDDKLLRLLLRNLIDNAFKYTETGGVLMAIRRRGGRALVQVWDTGIGIAPEYLDKIFEEYFQVGNPERDKSKGLGLGLSIVSRQARLLGTRIGCRSRPGKGSVFEFQLPFAAAAADLASGLAEPESVMKSFGIALAGRRIVLIEDDVLVAKALQLSFNSLGMRTTVYVSAEEALEDDHAIDADCYISDYRLPGATGIEMLEAIERRAGRPVKAVLLTGETSPNWLDAAHSARWQVLFKPIDLDELLTFMRG